MTLRRFAGRNGATATIGGDPIPETPDLRRMRHDRHRKLQQQLDLLNLDGLLLTTTNAVSYATGAVGAGADSGRASLMRPVAVIARGEPYPYLFTPVPESAPPELPDDRVRPPLYPDLQESAPAMVAMLQSVFGESARIGVDDETHPLGRELPSYEFVGTAEVLGGVKLCKTPDELACIRMAQRINELAMFDVQAIVAPGTRQTDLTALFLRRIFELGATSNAIDPIWQVMPLSKAEGPWTTHGDVAFPTPSTDRFLRDGDVIWVDTGISYEGYASDFGRTWIVGINPRPTPAQESQFERWCQVVTAVLNACKPGVSALELDQAATDANGGKAPWLEHFYLAHGVGTDSAEMPLVGTDLGRDFDQTQTLVAGMVLVIEPVIWDDGAGGYRSEDIVAVTDDGWIMLSDYPYDPYGFRTPMASGPPMIPAIPIG